MYKRKDIVQQLENMRTPQDSVVLMHTSLRSIGEVEGGGEGLLDILIDYFTSEGGLFCVPTHTADNLGKEKITLDMTAHESNLGTFAVIAAGDRRGIRSENPTHSMVVFGDRARAEAFIRDDANITTPTAPESCYGKIFDNGGYVLLAGVAQNKNTYLHCVAEMLKIPNRMSDKPYTVTVRKASGEIMEREWYLYDEDYAGDISLRFPKYETAFRYHRCITDGFIGNAPAQLCDAVKMKQTVERIFENCNGADPLANELPIPQSWYCTRSG